MKRFTKLFTTKATSVDDNSKTVTFKISDNQPDRMDEVVDQKSWDFKNYLKNPILLWGHNPDEPENVLGTCESLTTDPDGSATYASLRFDTDINPKAALVWNQIVKGTLNCVSVGFINHTFETDNDQPVLKDNELLEISVVPIPANPRAIALSLKEGTISKKDAKWLMESMRKEADLLEEQMKQPEVKAKEAVMTEEQGQALLDAVANLTTKVEEQNETIGKLQNIVDEQTAAREAEKVAADEAAKKAAEEAEHEEEEEEKAPAKPGDDDQGGAETEELDPEAELTPELQEQIDAALAEQIAA